MSARIPPQLEGRAIPGQDPGNAGKHRSKGDIRGADFASSLLSLLTRLPPRGKPSAGVGKPAGNAGLASARETSRNLPGKETRRKERTGRKPPSAAWDPAGTGIGLPSAAATAHAAGPAGAPGDPRHAAVPGALERGNERGKTAARQANADARTGKGPIPRGSVPRSVASASPLPGNPEEAPAEKNAVSGNGTGGVPPAAGASKRTRPFPEAGPAVEAAEKSPGRVSDAASMSIAERNRIAGRHAAPGMSSPGAIPVPGPAGRRNAGDRPEPPGENAGAPSAGKGPTAHRKGTKISAQGAPSNGGGTAARFAVEREPAPARGGFRADTAKDGSSAVPPGVPATAQLTEYGGEAAATAYRSTPAPAEAPHSPLFEQLSMKLAPMPDGEHTVEMRLSPERLGALEIELRIGSGRMDASLRADNPEARALLLREEPALREALRNAGVTLSSYHVSLADDPRREKRGTTRPDGDGGTPARRNRKEGPVEGIAAAGTGAERIGATGRTDHWIA